MNTGADPFSTENAVLVPEVGAEPGRPLAPNSRFLWKKGLTPCLSVGNLAMGGRGKTPVVGYLARLLLDAGERPAILSRGYGRRRPEDGVVIVSDGRHITADLDRSGDEPLMLARAVPGAAVLVCDVRAVARAVAERAIGATVTVLDDGFQHRAVPRDADIVIVTPDDLRDRRVPFGKLRESVSALRRAHAVIVDGDPKDADLRPFTGPVFALRRSLGVPVPIEPDRGWTPGSNGTVVAVAGIARPERFAQALGASGRAVARLVAFRDHHRYRRRDLDTIATAVRETGASMVLTTEKDAIRLRPLRPLPVPMAAVPLEVTVEPAAEFRAWVLARLREART